MARSSFKFRLKRLLDVREMREKQAQSELLLRRQEVVKQQGVLAGMQAEETQLRADQARPFGRGDDLQEFAQKRDWLEKAIKAKVQDQVTQQGVIQKAERAVVDQQDVVKQRGIEVKALEKVREKQREEHRVEQLREEGLFMDDLAGQGFLRRRTQAGIVEAEESAARAAREGEGAAS